MAAGERRTQLAIVVARRLGLGLGANPLYRPWDRIEAFALACAVGAALLAIPVAGAVGTAAYGRVVQASVERAEAGHETTAVVLADVPDREFVSAETPVSLTPVSRVRWQVPGVGERVGRIAVEPGTPEGTEISLWINASGDPIPAPTSHATTVWSAIGIGAVSLVGLELAVLLAYAMVRTLLDRSRLAWWESEWSRVEPGWSGR